VVPCCRSATMSTVQSAATGSTARAGVMIVVVGTLAAATTSTPYSESRLTTARRLRSGVNSGSFARR